MRCLPALGERGTVADLLLISLLGPRDVLGYAVDGAAKAAISYGVLVYRAR